MINTTVLAIQNLSVALPEWADRPYAVRDVSLNLYHNEVLCVVGESGSGKSVMARSVMGLLAAPHVRVSEGSILFEEEDLLQVSEDRMRAIRGNGIGMVFQEPMTALNPLMTIGQQIEELLDTHLKMSADEKQQRIVQLMEEVRLPEPHRILKSYPHQLSGGQRQRAMIVMALILEPSILIADEPTTALDVTTQAQILTLIKELQQRRKTGVMFITHDFGVVAEIADRVAVMKHGSLVEIGTVDKILNNPEHPYTQALIAAVPGATPPPRRPLDRETQVLSVENVVKAYPTKRSFFRKKNADKRALDGVSLNIYKGEILGLVGESGSGKSTLARCITRLLDPDEGKITVEDTDISSMSRKQLRPYRKRIQMIFQDPYASLNPRLTVAQLIAQGPIAQGVPKDEALGTVSELLELVKLDPSAANRFPHEFSGGQRQRVGIARALAMQPSILIADEPVSALDVSVQERILDLLLDIRTRLGVAMLFVTHDLRVAAQICDTMAVMYQGQIVEKGYTDTIFSDPQHHYTRSLLDAVPGRV